MQTNVVETIAEIIAIYTGGLCSALYASPHSGGGGWQGEQNCRQLHSSRNYCELLCFIPPPNSSTGKWGRLQYSPPSCFHSSRWRQNHSMPMAASSFAFMFLLQYLKESSSSPSKQEQHKSAISNLIVLIVLVLHSIILRALFKL